MASSGDLKFSTVVVLIQKIFLYILEEIIEWGTTVDWSNKKDKLIYVIGLLIPV